MVLQRSYRLESSILELFVWREHSNIDASVGIELELYAALSHFDISSIFVRLDAEPLDLVKLTCIFEYATTLLK